MRKHLVFMERNNTESILGSCPFLKNAQHLPSGHLLATYVDDNLGAPDYIKAVHAADSYKRLVTNLVADVLDTSTEEARLAVGERILLAPFGIYSSSKSLTTYTYLYNKKDSYRFPPTLSLHEGNEKTVYWFVIKQGCLEKLDGFVSPWRYWVDHVIHAEEVSLDVMEAEILRIEAPEGVHDPIIALYMMFIRKKRDQRILRILISGGTLDKALGMRKYAFE